MPSQNNKPSDVIAEFVHYYIENICAGRCREDQYGLTVLMTNGGYMFMAIDPDPRVDSDPTALAPRNWFPVKAHAVFKPYRGIVRFSSPATSDGAPATRHEMKDPVMVQFEQDSTSQVWLLSMDQEFDLDSQIEVKRADPASLTQESRTDAGQAYRHITVH